MCEMCENGGNFDAVVAILLSECERKGWAMTMVGEGDDGTLPYAYTCGRTRHGKNELVVVGFDPESSNQVLRAFINAEETGAVELRSGLAHVPESPHGAWLVDVDEDVSRYPLSIAHLIADVQTGRNSIHAVQIVAPDLEGKFPWQMDCDPVFGIGQPILGPVPTHNLED